MAVSMDEKAILRMDLLCFSLKSKLLNICLGWGFCSLSSFPADFGIFHMTNSCLQPTVVSHVKFIGHEHSAPSWWHLRLKEER